MPVITYFQQMWQLAINGETQGIWFWSAIYIGLMCAYSLVRQIRTRRWPATQGKLANSRLEHFGATSHIKSNQHYVSKALYHYDVAGQSYAGTRMSPWIFVVSHNLKSILERHLESIHRETNGTVKVFYDPDNPNKSFLILPGKIGVAVTALICVLPILLFWLKYHQ